MLLRIITLAIVFIFFSIDSQTDEPNPLPPHPSGTTIFLCGDVMTGRGVDQILPHSVDPRIYESYVKNAKDYVKLAERQNGAVAQPVSWDYIWGDAMEVWRKRSPAFKIINLETSVTDNGEPWPAKGIHYRMHPQNVKIFTEAGIDFASLANNHVLDWGRSGLLETLQTLSEAGVKHAGAGRNAEEAAKPAILENSEGSVVILAYGSESSGIPVSWDAISNQSGVNVLNRLDQKTIDKIKQQVQSIKQQGDIVIFSVHWGSNWGYNIPADQRKFAHQLIDEAGIDLIHGHSSHHPRAMEVYKGKLIMYGAGDFINDYEGISGHEEYRGDLSLMYFPELDPASGKLISLKMVPMQVKNLRLNHASSSDTKWLQKVLDRESGKFNTRVRTDEEGVLSLQW